MPEEKRQLIEKYQKSGQTQKQFCKEERTSFATLHYRLKKYRQESLPNQEPSCLP